MAGSRKKEERKRSEGASRRDIVATARNAFLRDIVASERWILVWVACVIFGAALFGARIGTPIARGLAAVFAILALALPSFVLRIRRARIDEDTEVLERLFARIDRERSLRAVRALRLRDVEDGSSAALRDLHLERSFFALPLASLLEDLMKRGRKRRVAGTALFCIVFISALVASFPLYEGFDVLLARNDRAPFSATWLDDVRITARPPAYLREKERTWNGEGEMALPVGTTLTISAKPAHGHREVFLDGASAPVPFVSDGHDRIVATTTLMESVQLQAAVRFGRVTIHDANPMTITSIPDAAPIVRLEDAPRSIDLMTTQETMAELKFNVTDDHGLREVALVLRSGSRNERRTIAKLDGETKTYEAGLRFLLNDRFVQKSHLPVEVTIEAKDNDPITGPKWGKSAIVEIRTPHIGEQERHRIDRLRDARDAYVDALALLLTPRKDTAADEKESRKVEQAALAAAHDKLEGALVSEHLGQGVSLRLASVLRARLGKFDSLVKAYLAGGGREKIVVGAEKFVLYLDGVLRGQGSRATKKVTRELADVAEELLKKLVDTETSAVAEKAGQEELLTLLDEGGNAMLVFGTLGRDIGEIAVAYVKRVRRGLAEKDRVHAILASADLLLRLRTPDPSFRAEGGEGGYGGSEGGSSQGNGNGSADGESANEGEPSEGDQGFEEGANEMDDLVQKHHEAMDKAEQAERGEGSQEERRERAEEGRRHAENVRKGISKLKNDDANEKQRKEEGEAMAGSLERGDLGQAAERGKKALKELEGLREGKDDATKKRVDEARNRIQEEVAWAEGEMKRQKDVSGKAKNDRLRDVGNEERRIGERARQFESGGDENAKNALREAEKRAEAAAEAFQKGDGPRGMAEQREAQRQLDKAREALQESQGDKSGEGGDIRGSTDIPDGADHKGPDEFRKRVLRGLSEPHSQKYGDAVRRYAEELL